VGLWELDLATGQTWRTVEHDRIFGYQELQPAWTVEDARRLVIPEDHPAFERALAQAMEAGHLHYVVRIQPPDRPQRWIAVEGEVLRDGAGRPLRVHGTVIVISERKELEARVSRAERLEAIATLVRGMSHEINSPLAEVQEALADAAAGPG